MAEPKRAAAAKPAAVRAVSAASAAPAAAAAPAAPAKKKGGKRALLWGSVALLLLGGGGGTWYALQAHATAKVAQAKKPAPLAAAIYYKFDPAFVVNFGAAGSSRYLQIGLEAMTRDQTVSDTIKNNEPAIRNDLILLFSSQNYDSLVSQAGKEQLRAQALAAIRKVVAANGNSKPVEAVYFTSFVIQ